MVERLKWGIVRTDAKNQVKIRALTRRSAFAALVSLVVALSTLLGGHSARALDLTDEDLFGHGETWPLPAEIEPGDAGPWVAQLQQRLAESGFRPGAASGQYGAQTLGAVYAFQKAHDLPRDGIFHDEYWHLLDEELSLPASEEQRDRIEVDLNSQVLYLVKDGQVEKAISISSGSGGTYRGRGGVVRARTPEGAFRAQRRVEGWRISYLGGLYRPFYFYGGYAIHGSHSVPPYPASHGCVRVSLRDMDYLVGEMALGMPIYIYGNRIERSSLLPAPPSPPEIPDQLLDLLAGG